MGQYCFDRWRLSPVVVCNTAGGRVGRRARAVGRPTPHGEPVVLRPVRATPCIVRNFEWKCCMYYSEREDGGAADAAADTDDEQTRREQGHGTDVHRSTQTRDEGSGEEHHKVTNRDVVCVCVCGGVLCSCPSDFVVRFCCTWYQRAKSTTLSQSPPTVRPANP